MGHGIAINPRLWGYPTIIYDLSDKILKKSMKKIEHGLDMLVGEALISRERAGETAGRITAATDFITEAIISRNEDKYH